MQLREETENPQTTVTPQALAAENGVEAQENIDARASEADGVWRGPEVTNNSEPATSRTAVPEEAWRSESVSRDGRLPAPADRPVAEAQTTALFPENELRDFRGRWDKVQGSFVDEPRQAVEQAAGLVASVVQRITEEFAGERSRLEQQWGQGKNVSTEDLRVALRRYRSLFDRLLSF